ncbi:MAG: hypothetical protein HYX59_13590 [Elusimicrobia bacterium]|nr:hypothetical protein [Elusimicrobiota bacterium]
MAESPEAFDKPSTALDAAAWTEANAAAVARTGFVGAAADLEAWTANGVTATDGAIPRETGAAEGEMDGAARDGVNDNDNGKTLLGIVPKTGSPGSEGLELAPAALDAPDAAEGTET